MSNSYFSNMFNAVRPYIDDRLISNEYMNRIESLVESLPEGFGLSDFGFEVPMDEGDFRADFMVSANMLYNGPRIFKRSIKNARSDSILERFMVFWHSVAEGENKNQPMIDEVCFEYDLTGAVCVEPKPCVFFFPISDRENRGRLVKKDDLMFLIDELGVALDGCCIAASAIITLSEVLDVIEKIFGPNKKILIGLMLTRGRDLLRLVININNRDKLLNFLNEIGWSGDCGNLFVLLDSWLRLIDNVNLNIDIGENVNGKIGFELYFGGGGEKDYDLGRWSGIFDYCIATGVCDAKKISKLYSFVGYGLFEGEGNNSLTNSYCPLLYSLSQVFLIRRLYHIKMVYNSASGLKCKSYFGVKPYFRPSLFCQ